MDQSPQDGSPQDRSPQDGSSPDQSPQDRSPEAYRAALQQGIACAQEQDWSGAIAAFDEALVWNPIAAEAYYRRGLARFDAGQAPQAAFDYTKALELHPDYPGAYYGRALARLVLKNLAGTIADVDEVLARDPQNPAAHQLRATALRKQGHLEAAIQAFRTAAEHYLDRRDAAAARQCLDLIQQIQPKPIAPPPVSVTLTQASTGETIEGHPGDRAGSLGSAGSQTIPTNPTALIRSGASWAEMVAGLLQHLAQSQTQADPAHAINQVRIMADWALQVDPQDKQAYLVRGAARCLAGDWPGAISDLNRAIATEPPELASHDRAEAYRYRGRAKRAAGDSVGALEDFSQAITWDETRAVFWLDRAQLHHDRGDVAGTIADANRALELDPQLIAAYLLRAQAHARHEDTRLAAADYQTAADVCCRLEDWPGYRDALDRLQKLQQALPKTAQAASPTENPLKQRLRILVGGQWDLADRLIDQARAYYPGMSDDWYLEKVIYDIERDRQGNED